MLGAQLNVALLLLDIDRFAAVNEVYGERFGADPPARATVEVSRLPKDALVEIDAIALIQRKKLAQNAVISWRLLPSKAGTSRPALNRPSRPEMTIARAPLADNSL